MLTDRQEEILAAIIKDYTHTAIPVSSQTIVEKYDLGYSSATIRNEMMDLEEMGYLLKPHISAGRIPSDKGYRHFVDNLMQERELSKDQQRKLQLELLKLKAQNARLTRTTAKLLSGMSQCLALSGIVDQEEYSDFGMHELLDSPDFSNLDEVAKLSSALDLIDENIDVLLSNIKNDETKIFIGEENPLKEIQNCSMVVSPYQLKSGEKGIVAIIGPKRMKYDKNKSLIDFVKKMLGRADTLSIIIILAIRII